MRLRLLPALALLITGTAVAAGCGNSSSAQTERSSAPPTPASSQPAAGPVNVKLSEFKVQPSRASARAGKVSFDVTNSGKAPHELVVLKTQKPAAALGKGTRIPETGHVGEVGDLKPGAGGKVSLKLKPGHYSLV